MKKTLIALALATVAAPTVAAPIEKFHTKNFDFSRKVDHQCGINVDSLNDGGKLLITGEGAELNRAPRFTLVNNGAGYPDGTPTKAEISIVSNGLIKTTVPGAKYDVFLAENTGFESSQPIVDFEGDKNPEALQNDLEWGKEYRTQLRLQITDNQKAKLNEGEELKATLKLKIEC